MSAPDEPKMDPRRAGWLALAQTQIAYKTAIARLDAAIEQDNRRYGPLLFDLSPLEREAEIRRRHGEGERPRQTSWPSRSR